MGFNFFLPGGVKPKMELGAEAVEEYEIKEELVVARPKTEESMLCTRRKQVLHLFVNGVFLLSIQQK